MRRIIRKNKFVIFLSMLVSLFIICIIFLVLTNYLHVIRNKERLLRVEDYSKFSISYNKQNRCKETKKFTFSYYDGTVDTYYYQCMYDVYLSYGSTTISLENALNNEYINFHEVLDGSRKVFSKDNVAIYNSRKGSKYQYSIMVITKDEGRDIIFAPLNN